MILMTVFFGSSDAGEGIAFGILSGNSIRPETVLEVERVSVIVLLLC